MKKIFYVAAALLMAALCSSGTLYAQDVITLKSGEDIKVIVREVGTTEVKYTKYENAQGPTYTLLKADIFMIRYENGSKDVFSAETAQAKPAATTVDARANTLSISSRLEVTNKYGVDLDKNEVRKILASNPPALDLFNSGHSQNVLGTVFAGIGGGLIGGGLGITLAGGAGEVPEIILICAGGGLAFLAVGLPVAKAGQRKVKRAINMYNESVTGGATAYNYNLNFGITPSGGVGFTLNF